MQKLLNVPTDLPMTGHHGEIPGFCCRQYYVYIPPGGEGSRFPVRSGMYSLSYGSDIQYYRVEQFTWVWLEKPGECLTVWHFQQTGKMVCCEVYRATEDPALQDPQPQEFILQQHDGYVNIIGLRHYCQLLRIPAFIQGMPVRKVYISSSERTEDLRSLTVEDGVRELYFDFRNSRRLTHLDLPPSLMLMTPPDGILQTPWFSAQHGQVYLQNWYCGTVGAADSDTLILRPGTLGVIANADLCATWQKLILPETVSYIGVDAFMCSPGKDELVFPPEKKLAPTQKNRHTSKPKALMPKTPKELYDLGRTPRLRRLVPRGFEPVAPLLTYSSTDGWKAEFWYCSADAQIVGYNLTLRLRDRTVTKRCSFSIIPPDQGIRTECYTPPFFFFAEEYLEECLKSMEAGKPTVETLKRLKEAWRYCNPNAFNRWLSGGR